MTLKVIHWLQALSNAIRRTFVQHFTQFQLSVCSHSHSALAELLSNVCIAELLNSITELSEKLYKVPRLDSFKTVAQAVCIDTVRHTNQTLTSFKKNYHGYHTKIISAQL